MVELIALHIPKTGGVSFEHVLRSVYGKSHVLRADLPIWAEEVKKGVKRPPAPGTIPIETKAIIGHFRLAHLLEKYGLTKNIPAVTWVRHPVERVVSDFYFHQRFLRERLGENIPPGILPAIQRNLLEFARVKGMRNRMSRFLMQDKLDNFAFVGILEFFEEDLSDLANLMGWNSYARFRLNVTKRESLDTYEAGEQKEEEAEVLEEIKELNSDDMALYRRATEMRARRISASVQDQQLLGPIAMAGGLSAISTYSEKKPITRKRIFIEATKLIQPQMDGSKRYTAGLLRGFLAIVDEWTERFEFHVSIEGRVIDINELAYALPREIGVSRRSASKWRKVREATESVVLGVWYAFRRWFFSPPVSGLLIRIKSLFPRTWNVLKSIKDKFTSKGLPSGTDSHGYDLIHLTIPQNTTAPPGRLVMTVYDFTHLFFPEFHVAENSENTKKGLDFAVSKEAAFIAISQATQKDLIKQYNVSPDDVAIIHLGCDRQVFSPKPRVKETIKVLRKFGVQHSPFFIYSGTLEPRKNLSNTLRAFLLMLSENPKLNARFVLVGKKGWKYQEIFQGSFRNHPRIIFAKSVRDSELAILYSEAIALCYASYYEGFGLPPLEAMSCGTPVIFGNNSSLPEIVGEGGLAVDPNSIVEIKEKMLVLATQKNLREQLSEKALRRAKDFSWEKTARETLRVYENLLKV